MSAPILVVDDNDDAQEFLSSTLTDAGFGVLQARDGREALALLVDKAAAPRLVIVDLIMPIMDGAATIVLSPRCDSSTSSAALPITISMGVRWRPLNTTSPTRRSSSLKSFR